MDAISIKNAIAKIDAIEDEISIVGKQLNKHYSQARKPMTDDVKQSRMDMAKAIGHLRRAKFYLVQAMAAK